MIACNSSEKWLYDRIYCPSNRSKQMQESHMAYSAGTQFSLNEKHTWLSQTIIVRLVIFDPVLGFKRELDMHYRTILAFAELFMVLYRTFQCSKYNVDSAFCYLKSISRVWYIGLPKRRETYHEHPIFKLRIQSCVFPTGGGRPIC